MARATTPQDLIITPRDRRFGRGMTQERWWMGGDPVATAFYNALSATFPKGEAYFVETIFNPWNVAEKLSSPKEVMELKESNPKALHGALHAIAESEANHASTIDVCPGDSIRIGTVCPASRARDRFAGGIPWMDV